MMFQDLEFPTVKGIERFTYATDLFAANNKLTSVNITKNTKVAYLNLSNNSLAGTLDLSKCTNLRVVKYGSNKLTKVVNAFQEISEESGFRRCKLQLNLPHRQMQD